MRTNIFISPTTHWDREWVQPQIQFQIRLVDLVDKLLRILEEDPAYKCFVFDGQTIALQDYLEIKPENRERIARLCQQGRIVVGPWYVLADQFLEDAESTVRNLMIGMRQSLELGAKAMPVCYVPDSFGSIDSLPMIAAGFGLTYIMFGRGRPADLPKGLICFIWQTRDGSSALTANHGYGNGLFLSYPDIWTNIAKAHPEKDVVLKEMQRLLVKPDKPVPFRNKYFSVGIDHMEPRASLPDIVRHLNEQFEDCEFSIESPEAYMRAVSRAGAEFVRYSGEMRGPDVRSFNGCLSSHIDLKQKNFRAQMQMSRYIEPLSVLAYATTGAYPMAFIGHLWRLLLANHPHDSICGCSVDRVHDDMRNRYARIDDAGEMLTERAVRQITGNINLQHRSPEAAPVVVFNTVACVRTDAVQQWVRVPRRFQHAACHIVTDEGKQVPGSVKLRAVKQMDLESLPMTTARLGMVLSKDAPASKPDDDVLTVLEVEFVAPDVPALGYRTFWICPGVGTAAPTDLSLTSKGMKNARLDVAFHANGTFDLTDLKSGRVFPKLHYFEDTEDIGDAYGHRHFTKPDVRTTLSSAASIEALDILPHRITYRVTIPWALPKCAGKGGRDSETDELTITSELTLWSNTDRLEVSTTFTNNSRNHRLRAVFDMPFAATHSSAEGNFSVTRRVIPTPEESMEAYPQQAMVCVADADTEFALLNRGLPEFEAVNTLSGTRIYLTLLRSVGELGCPSGANHPVPATYCLGAYRAEYAVCLRSSRDGEPDVLSRAHAYTTPLYAAADIQHPGAWPNTGSMMESEPGVSLTAFKNAESNLPEIVFRLWNATYVPKTARLGGVIRFARACVTNLNEEIIEECPVENGRVVCPIAPFAIATVKATIEQDGTKPNKPDAGVDAGDA